MKLRGKPRVAVIYNRDFEGAIADPENRAREDIKNVAVDVLRVLTEAGHDVIDLGLRDDVASALSSLREREPMVVFNLCESLKGDNRFEALVPMLLELEGMVYTGSGPLALLQALHKGKAKQLLQATGVATPRGFVFETVESLSVDQLDGKDIAALRFPLIVKPTREDASVGISGASVVRDRQALIERVTHVLEQYRQPALAEEYIEGRELNVSILEGPNGPEVLPIHEIDFSQMPAERPNIVSFEAKWVEDSVEYHGTQSVPCAGLTSESEARITATALAAFRALDLRDYGRVDLRLSSDGTPYVIDVNPNCDLSSEAGGFSRAVKAAGLTYQDLILRLVSLAMNRRQDADTIPLSIRSRDLDRPHRSQEPGGGESVSPGGGLLRHRAPRSRAGSA